ncbi:MAG: tRNA (guanosine(46)-N7)-methyltransferase TrmB [Clostridiales bacterium]|nr:tRNA (guanosine(46)-N7)-methyltransferase TrmB [Clostridiales bacterium]
MRMHKKAHLEERIASCGGIVTVADLSDKNMQRAATVKEHLDFTKIFKNTNPVHLEIGCGKGKFVCETAKLFPDINFLACEKISNVLIEALEAVKESGLKNVYFLNCAAEVLPKYIPDGSIGRVYLNFSNPLPKEGYKKQRLTHPKFLNMYSQFLADGGEIIQKTDDGDFYTFSLESYKVCGFEILSVDENYKGSEKDIETEHEKKFKKEGKNIYRIVCKKSG